MTPTALADLVVAVTARVLGASEARVRADRGRYAAFQRDDAFAADHIDWRTLRFTKAGRAAFEGGVYGRRDIDVARSWFGSAVFGPKADDLALRPVFKRTPALSGAQVSELVVAGRVEPAAIGAMTGRILGGESLVEAMTALLALDGAALKPPRGGAVHPRWRAWVVGLPASARAKVGMFFQTEDAARTAGACFDGRGETPEVLAPRFEVIAAWEIGEAQGELMLARILDDREQKLPAFRGKAAPAKASAPRVGSLAAFMKRPLSEHLRESYSYSNIRELLGSQPEKDLGALLSSEDGIVEVAMALSVSLQEKHHRVVVAVSTRALQKVPALWQLVFENLRANGLVELGFVKEAHASALRCLALVEAPQTKRARMGPSAAHNLVAWTAYKSGDLALAVTHARAAVTADKKNFAAHATLGAALFAAGDEDEAMVHLEKAMAKGIDPEPEPALRGDARYRKLCARHGIRADAPQRKRR